MKKSLLKVSLIFAVAVMMTSCYTFTATVGNGPQTGAKVVSHNHYLINGLAPISTAKTKELVGDAKDYSITVSHSFIDGFLAILTSGIYTPTTVTITK
ncbi:MAG: Bor family protein [Paludibacter sp.]|nr:Bor family protein [Paludibacter sp.]